MRASRRFGKTTGMKQRGSSIFLKSLQSASVTRNVEARFRCYALAGFDHRHSKSLSRTARGVVFATLRKCSSFQQESVLIA